MALGSGIHPRVFMVFLVMSAAFTGSMAADAPWKTYLKKPDEWYRGQAGRVVAANVLSYQSDRGSWPKNLDTTVQPYTGDRRLLQGTFDNGATFGELRFLSRAYQATHDATYRDAFLLGLDHVLRARYPTGGWPQFFPPGKGYHRHITFNDGAMVNILDFLTDVAHSSEFTFVDEARRSAAGQCFLSGIQCILKCQIKVNGKLTIWCAQHDEKTLEPRWGRSFEPPALTSSESAGILRLLMTQENPGPEIKQAVHAGARWFADSQINGIRQTHVNGDKVIVKDQNAPALWSRFYEIGTNRPIFCGRDGIIKYDIAQIETERRNGYAWYGTWGLDVASRYARWKEQREMKHVPARSEISSPR
jgi:PelA/Pel-15E family pectate lyase